MRPIHQILVVAGAAAWWCGCEREQLPSAPATPPANRTETRQPESAPRADLEVKADEGLALAAEMIQNSRARYEREFDSELARARAQAERLNEQLATAVPAEAAAVEARLAALKERMQVAGDRLAELPKVADAEYPEFRVKMEEALDRLREALGPAIHGRGAAPLPTELTTLPARAPQFFELPSTRPATTQPAGAPGAAPPASPPPATAPAAGAPR